MKFFLSMVAFLALVFAAFMVGYKTDMGAPEKVEEPVGGISNPASLSGMQ